MTRTIVASATREIIIGFDQPFCVIGERINPTGRRASLAMKSSYIECSVDCRSPDLV